jgi:hypothetical protein
MELGVEETFVLHSLRASAGKNPIAGRCLPYVSGARGRVVWSLGLAGIVDLGTYINDLLM